MGMGRRGVSRLKLPAELPAGRGEILLKFQARENSLTLELLLSHPLKKKWLL